LADKRPSAAGAGLNILVIAHVYILPHGHSISSIQINLNDLPHVNMVGPLNAGGRVKTSQQL
jgi:hypothetical protein